MKVDMNLLKQLRGATFAPLKDCKDALVAADGNLDEAINILKEKGILKAGKKANRETKEGLTKFISDGEWTVGAKLLCETDFVAKNEVFLQLLDDILDELLKVKENVSSIEELNKSKLDELNNMIISFVGKIGENVKLDNVVITNNNVFVYNHAGNKVATMIYYTGDDEDVAKEIALQVAAMNPTYLSIEKVPGNIYNELKVKFEEEMKDSGKPAEIMDSIIKGKINKTLSDFVLMEQSYIRNGSKKIKDIIPEGFVLKDFVRMSIYG